MALNADESANRSDRKQQVLVLYLRSSALDSEVIGWAMYDGNDPQGNGPGAQDSPPYKIGVQALADGWRLFQSSTLRPAPKGQEFQTDYLKYEFFFEKFPAAERGDAGNAGETE